MRDLEAESKLMIRLAQVVGALFLLGLIAIAIGTEILILDMWTTSPASFWIWQGVWAVAQAVVLSNIVSVMKKGLSQL